MNPWALLVVGLALVLIIMSVKNTQGNVKAALTGKQPSRVFPIANAAQ